MAGVESSNAELLRENERLRKQVAQLQQAQNWLLKFELGIERTDEVVFLTDPQGVIEYINPAFTRVYGYPSEEALGSTPRILKSGKYPAKFYDHFWQTILEREVVSGILVNRTKSGDLITVQGSANPILDKYNNVVGYLAIQQDITAQKRAEQVLKLSQAAMEASMDGMAILDEQTQFSYVNESFLRMYGYALPEDLLGHSWRILYDQHYQREIDQKIRPALEKQGKWRGETIGTKRDGIRFHQELSLSQIDSGGFICIVHDITKRKRAEKTLRASEEKFRGIFENTTAGIALIDIEDQIIQMNQAYASMLGYTVKELVGKTVGDITHPEDPEENGRRQADLITGAVSAVQMEKLFRHHDGHIVCGLASATLIRNDEGEPLNFLCHVVDITHRKSVERALADSERDFRSMFENMQEGIYRVTPEGEILMANPGLAHMLGYEHSRDLTGKNIYDLGAWDSAALDRYRKEMEHSGHITNFQHVQYTATGEEIHVRENAHAVRDADGELLYYQGMYEDITEQKALEHQLVHAQRMENLGHIASGIAHDFNNVMASISGALQMMETVNSDSRLRKYIEIAHSSIERGESVTNRMTGLARSERPALKIISLQEFLQTVQEILIHTLPKTISVRVKPYRGNALVRADKSQLQQVLLNLCINAADAMPGGGSITLGMREPTESECQVHEQEALEYFCLFVSDTGMGIEEEVLGHIFEPFFTTKEREKGTGLGLAVSYKIIQNHEGWIEVESRVGEGTTFVIGLPRTDDVIIAAPSSESDKIPSGAGERILVVEDEDYIRELLMEKLRSSGYQVITAEDGLMALEMLQDTGEEIALILTDLGLPRLNGRQLATQVRSSRPEILLLAMTGYINEDERETLLNLGFQRIVQKPFDFNDLLTHIGAVLDNV